MSMSDHERALLVTGTLDTSGVGGSPYAELDQVAVAFGAEVHEGDHIPQEAPVKAPPEPEEKEAEKAPSEPEETAAPEEPKAEEPKPAARTTKRAPAKKAQASKPADE